MCQKRSEGYNQEPQQPRGQFWQQEAEAQQRMYPNLAEFMVTISCNQLNYWSDLSKGRCVYSFSNLYI